MDTMKQIFLLLFTCFSLLTDGQTNGFQISGRLINAEGKKLYLTQRGNGLGSGSEVVMFDSCFVSNGCFFFKGRLNEPDYYSILVENGKGWQCFILENSSELLFVGNADSIWKSKVTGSEENRLADSLNAILSPIIKRNNKAADECFEARRLGDTLRAKELDRKYTIIEKEFLAVRVDFIQKHPDSFVSLYQLLSIYDFSDKQLSENLYNGLSDRLKQHSKGKEIQYQLFGVEKVFLESVSFSQSDTSGKIVSTNLYRGNYLLVDFWASWCGPCRAENPNLKKAYDQYKNKGFEIIAVSLDSKKADWLNAIKKDNLTWIQVSDLKGWRNEIALKYGIKSIPFNMLLDKDGNIIAKDLRGEKLLKKLSEIYDN